MTELKGGPMPTIREIAQEAGVSIATVSRVINKKGQVNESTKEKVQKVIEELKYKPDPIAVSLNSKKSKTIGLIMPDITNPYFPELAKVVEREAVRKGYNLILCNSDNDPELEKIQVAMIDEKYIDGLIIASDSFNKSYLKRDIPVVGIDRVSNSEFSTVTADNYKGAQLAVQHLLDIGCEKVAHISGPQNVRNAQDRLKGYKDIVENKPWYQDSYIIDGEYNLEKAFEATKRLLEQNEKIDGIFAANDIMGVGVLKALYSSGIKVPKEIAVVGFDGIAFSKITIPELSTVVQPIQQMALEAVNMLFKHIETDHQIISHKQLEVRLSQRESTIYSKSEEKQ
jgi:LacI family transcriptional regulator